MGSAVLPSVFPLVWSRDVRALCEWATRSLGLELVWQVPPGDGEWEHAELRWAAGIVSVNYVRDGHEGMGPAGIAVRQGDRAAVDACHARAVGAGAKIVRGPEESLVSYSFTAEDPDGNQWWIHVETGALDELRDAS